MIPPFSWPPNPSTGGGGGGGGGTTTATELATTADPVNVSDAAPPEPTQVLTAIDATHAEWRVPGLRYDGGVRFNLGLSGTASIDPGTWGLANELPLASLGGTITIVSSLSAPPVNSRFAVYVARAVIKTVKVTIVGAASIQALDGTLQPSITVPPGAFLEWVLYHDPDLGAVWGLVSDTAGLSKRFAAPWAGEDVTFPIVQPSAPSVGSVLTFSTDHAVWALANLATDAQHGDRGGGTLHVPASGSVNGFMSAADFAKLAGIATGAAALTPSPPTSIQPGVSAAVGAATLAARSDHVHNVPVGTPSTLAAGGTNTIGSATTLARADHIHQLPALATTSADGFLSSSDKTKLNNLDLDISTNTFRLSNQSGGSGISNDNAAATTVYLNQYNGNRIALYSGLTWVIVTPASAMSAAINTATGGATAGVPIDAFCQYASATSATLSLVSWTNTTTRAFPLTQQDGVWVRASQLTQRYVGTVLPTGTSQFAHVTEASGSTSPVCGIWNRYNRIRGAFVWTPTFDAWTIASVDTWQPINAQASAKIQVVQGQVIDAISAEHVGAVNAGGATACIGLGLNSSSAPTGLRDMGGVSGSIVSVRAVLQRVMSTPGVYSLNALAIATGTSAIFYGTHEYMQGGLTADLWY